MTNLKVTLKNYLSINISQWYKKINYKCKENNIFLQISR